MILCSAIILVSFIRKIVITLVKKQTLQHPTPQTQTKVHEESLKKAA